MLHNGKVKNESVHAQQKC